MNILFLGTKNGTSLDRANAYRRLGHFVDHIDLREMLPKTVWVDRIIWHIGGDWLSSWLPRRVRKKIGDRRFELCHVDGGELVTPDLIAVLRQNAGTIVNYNIDDPLGSRDKARWRAYRQSVPFYDLCVVMRPQNMAEARSLGAKNVLHVFRSADEISHAPRCLTTQDHNRWDSEVLFLGTWFPERGPFLLELVRRGIPLNIRGDNWSRAKEWSYLEPYWKGSGIHGDDYAKAIQCAKVNLGLLSKGNRDLHTTRSLEVPALGSLLCAERTTEHLGMYQEGKEALFWGDVDECAAMCRYALEDEQRRLTIAAAGRERIVANGNYNEQAIKFILERLFL
jgi:hypothetical protein